MSLGSELPFSPILSLPWRSSTDMMATVAAPYASLALRMMEASRPPGAVISLLSVCEALLESERFVIGIDPDPLALLPIMVLSQDLASDQVTSAFTHWVDAPYRGRPWSHTLQSLYLTSCPACGRPTSAYYYRWGGSPPAMIGRYVRCQDCDFEGEAAAESADMELAAEVQPGRLLEWDMMSRVVASAHPLRPRVEQVKHFYTSRALFALWQSLRILQDLGITTEQRRALQWLGILALWRGSNLMGEKSLLWQPTLRRPRSFVEYNVWQVLNEALEAYTSRPGHGRPPRSSSDLHHLDTTGSEGFFLAQRQPGDVSKRIPEAKAAMVMISVPPPLPVVWLLRFAWSGWLFGESAAARLQDYQALRSGSTLVLTRLIESATRAGRLWLHQEGGMVMQWRWRDDEDPSTAIIAGTPGIEKVGVVDLGDSEWIAIAQIPTDTLILPGNTSREDVARQAMAQALRDRGEPVRPERLRLAILAAWRNRTQELDLEVSEERLTEILNPEQPHADFIVCDDQGQPWQPGELPWWWLAEPPPNWRVASDEAETHLRQYLQDQIEVQVGDLRQRLLCQLPLTMAPDQPWVDALLHSYCVRGETGVRLRPQDDLARRQEDLDMLARALMQRGQHHGYDTATWTENGLRLVEWHRQSHRKVSFMLTASTAITPRLWSSRAHVPGLQRFLILPGGRAGLVQWRIDHQPLWAEFIAAGGWNLVKFRQLRVMLRDMQPEANQWLAQLSLDPFITSQAEQMRLL